MKILLIPVLALAALSSGSIVKAPGDTFELLILHNNDMHACFEQTSQASGVCTIADREAGKCYGGFPRVAHVVKEARRAAHSGEGPPVLYLNAGDTYTGTAWFTIYKWKIAAEFVNALKPDAVSLGNNEVNGQEISPFLENLNTDILACNVIIKSAEGKANIKKSIIFEINGVQVGVVGYLTPKEDDIAYVEYIDEVIAITEEVEKLQALGVKIIIALGHSILSKEMEIAKEVAGIDLVIAGNKNTFYWNGSTVSDTPHQPTVVTQESGKQVPIIPSMAYNKYLGSLRVKFDENGEILEYSLDPILLDTSVPEDPASLNLVEAYNSELVSKSTEVIGQTAVVLDGESCSTEECNFGNFITDAITYFYATQFEGDHWTDTPVAIIHSGAIARSIAPADRPADITTGELLAALPLGSTLVAVTMNGAVLTQVLEHSVSDYSQQNPTGRFLQFSGIRVVYDLEKEPGSRLVNAVVRCSKCTMPEFFSIDVTESYTVLMPAALANGEFGYSMLTQLPKVEMAYDEVSCTTNFINVRSPVYPEVAGRIVLQNVPAIPDEPSSATIFSSSLLLITQISAAMILYSRMS